MRYQDHLWWKEFCNLPGDWLCHSQAKIDIGIFDGICCRLVWICDGGAVLFAWIRAYDLVGSSCTVTFPPLFILLVKYFRISPFPSISVPLIFVLFVSLNLNAGLDGTHALYSIEMNFKSNDSITCTSPTPYPLRLHPSSSCYIHL